MRAGSLTICFGRFGSFASLGASAAGLDEAADVDVGVAPEDAIAVATQGERGATRTEFAWLLCFALLCFAFYFFKGGNSRLVFLAVRAMVSFDGGDEILGGVGEAGR